MEKLILAENSQRLEDLLAERKILTLKTSTAEWNVCRIGQEVFVFEKGCPHFDYPLKKGAVNAYKQVVCAWHNYKFDLHTGHESQHRCRSLRVTKAYRDAQRRLVAEV